ncbi:MAG: glycosyltransferase family 4 protein [Bacteroidetes bacterium HGW-Bacteroidetes-22]|nr:MAG: glycosyltransferase family 4 protein [Bacteroidetes bacterium HGW-Bacteroidetes-22]
MKIIYYLPSLHIPGGLERIITFKANYFADHFGYDVTIITSEQNGQKPFFPLSEKVKHTDIDVKFDFPSNQSKLKKLLLYPFKYQLFKQRFSRYLYDNRPDITISTIRRELNFLNKVQDGSLKIGEFHVTRYSYHANAFKNKNIAISFIKKLWAKSFVEKISRLKKFVVLTHVEAGFWPELNNIEVIPDPLTIFPDTVSLRTTKQVVAVGRYTYEKGFDMLIDCWKIVSEKHPDWILKVYGGGDHTTYDALVKKLQIEATCKLENSVSDITAKYLESSMFVSSSRFEGFGMAITEAMACGLPIISFACDCGPKEIVTDGVDGYLVQPDNTQELADKICSLIENPTLRNRMGETARVNSARYNLEIIAGKWKELFERLVDQ